MVTPNLERLPDWIEGHSRQTLALSGAVAVLIALTDAATEHNVSLGLLYALPIMLASAVLSRLQIVACATTAALLREAFSPFRWQSDYAIRIVVTSTVFSGIGLLVAESARNRRLTVATLRQEQRHLLFQAEADRQIRMLVEASPLSFVLTDALGTILLANKAFAEFSGVAAEPNGESLFAWLPALQALVGDLADSDPLRRMEMETAGANRSGHFLYAHVWMTPYRTQLPGAVGDLRVAWVLWDASEDTRGRDLAHKESMDMTARVLLAAFSHEVKNLSSVAVALGGRLASRPGLGEDPDLRALSGVLASCSELAANGLQLGQDRPRAVADLGGIMDQVRVTIQPMAAENGISLDWNISGRLPLVHGEQGSLIQVFLNLYINSQRSLRGAPGARIAIDASPVCDSVEIRFRDNGPGVSDPSELFTPFNSHRRGAGLGLYVSRAIVKAFSGDLWYESGAGGACFVIRLRHAPEAAVWRSESS